MTEKVQVATAAEKHSCCTIHLKPLLERINSLEQRLLVETERREKEYNELLHILVVIKHQKKGDTSATHIEIHSDKQLSKLTLDEEGRKKRTREAHTAKEENKTSPVAKSLKKAKPIRKSSVNVKKIDLPAPLHAQSHSKARKEAGVAGTLELHQSEINKLKELNNYLMEQLLVVFEQVKEVKAQNVASSPKSFPTQETINSMVFDAQQREAAHDQGNDSLERRVDKISSLLQQNSKQLRESNSKILEHEAMLSELIGLTRGLSNRIVEIPLYLNSSYDSSPSKQ